MNKYKSLSSAVLFLTLTLMTGCSSGDEDATSDSVHNTAVSSQASVSGFNLTDSMVNSQTLAPESESADKVASSQAVSTAASVNNTTPLGVESTDKGASNDLSKSKGTDQDVIVSLVPTPEQENVPKSTMIEATFSVPLDVSAIQEHNVKLTYLSSKTNEHITGTISYSETEKKLTFRPNDLLEPGLYEVEIKSLKAEKAYKDVKIDEIKYRFIVVKEILKRIVVTPEIIDIQEGESIQLKAEGLYDNNTSENITDTVEWQVTNTQMATIDADGSLSALQEGITTVVATLQGVEASIGLTVYKEMHGHRLPPEPDPAVNNATLLGVDSNSNGVRDDVERWIYTRYDTYVPCTEKEINVTLPNGKVIKAYEDVCEDEAIPYHQIVREIAMQGARAAQIIIQEPEKARETTKLMEAGVNCSSYFQTWAQHRNEPILFNKQVENDYSIIGKQFDEVQFNTAMRARAYGKYNFYLSGGVYSANETPLELRQACDFDVDALLGKEQ
ncbi:Ig-like domain-containing protein [Sulfurovum sp.]|uniref:Ig-like domain-containing protein n=1 Tax=Sulfurovum sp. TaxID=1969726 RepID=UPI0035616396